MGTMVIPFPIAAKGSIPDVVIDIHRSLLTGRCGNVNNQDDIAMFIISGNILVC